MLYTLILENKKIKKKERRTTSILRVVTRLTGLLVIMTVISCGNGTLTNKYLTAKQKLNNFFFNLNSKTFWIVSTA